MKTFIERLGRETRGTVLAIGAAGVVALVGGAGLGVDTVQWYLWKRQLQQAVDSSALAGAHALSQSAAYENAATTDLNRNADTAVVIEQLANPPTTGAYAGNSNAVEVIATTSRALPFSSLFLTTAPVIRARAVATSLSEGEHCVIALAGSGVGVNVGGSANIELGCGVAANSEGTSAVYLEGSSYLNATPLSTVGGIQASTSNYSSGTVLQPYGSPQADPMLGRNLQVPTSPSTCTASSFEAPPNRTTSIVPGRYCNGLALKGTVNMAPGVYIVDRGSFYVASGAVVTGPGVTIVLTGSDSSNIAVATIAGGATLEMRAPTAVEDPYWKNVLFFQDPRATSQLSEIAGGSSLNLEGVLYMPKGNLRFAGNSGQHSDCLLIVANRVTLTGTTSLDNSCPSDYDDLNLTARRIRVVE